MEIHRAQLQDAVKDGLLTESQSEALWQYISRHNEHEASFRFTHILYYLGGMIVIGAMTWFMTLGWERFGGWGLFAIALCYAVAALYLTEYLLHRKHLPIPAGITAALVIVLVPIAVYGLQVALGFWVEGRVYRDYHVWIDWRWMLVELVTLGAGVILLWRYRLPFLVMPIAVTLWYMSMTDLAPFLFGQDSMSWELSRVVSLWFGLFMLAVALWVDIRTRHERDFAFWLYLFGVIAFWCGLSFSRSDSEFSKFLYLCINLLLIVIGGVLTRKVFVVFGAFGVVGYLTHLSYNVFRDSMIFPFALTAIGFGVICFGIFWHRNEAAFSKRARGVLPATIRELLDRRL